MKYRIHFLSAFLDYIFSFKSAQNFNLISFQKDKLHGRDQQKPSILSFTLHASFSKGGSDTEIYQTVVARAAEFLNFVYHYLANQNKSNSRKVNSHNLQSYSM